MATKRAKLDICRINTARLRTMNRNQLLAAAKRVSGTGPYGNAKMSVPLKERKQARGLLDQFIFNLRGYYEHAKPRKDKLHTDNYTPEDDRKFRDGYKYDAAKIERQIWDLQAKKGCKIPMAEQVARDAQAEGRHSVANRLRRSKKREPMHYPADMTPEQVFERIEAGTLLKKKAYRSGAKFRYRLSGLKGRKR